MPSEHLIGSFVGRFLFEHDSVNQASVLTPTKATATACDCNSSSSSTAARPIHHRSPSRGPTLPDS